MNDVRTIPFRTDAEQRAALAAIVAHLRGGGVIAYPTETVYGFGCLLREPALTRLARAKRRTDDRPFLVLVADRRMIRDVQWTAAAESLANAFWPGALTLALKATGSLPREVLSTTGTVAIRATPHAGIRALIDACGEPITSTSANIPGAPPAHDAAAAGEALRQAAPDWPALVLDGGTLPASRPSTIVDCSIDPPAIIRVGAIDTTAIAEILNGPGPDES